MDENQKEKFKSLVELHNNFSKAYKAVEPIVENMDATTLNEARYALRAIVDCIQIVTSDAKDDNKFDDSARTAELALRIVWHDVVDITFDSFRIYLDELGKQYGPDIVAKHIDINSCRKLLALANNLVKQSRGDRSLRIELYAQITNDHLDELVSLFDQAKLAEPAISAARKKECRDNFYKIFGAVVSTIILSTIIYVNFIK